MKIICHSDCMYNADGRCAKPDDMVVYEVRRLDEAKLCMNSLCPECRLSFDDELNKWWEISSGKSFEAKFYFNCPHCDTRFKVVVTAIPTFKIERTGSK